MTVDAMVSGKLLKSPEVRSSSAGKPFTSCTLKIIDGNEARFIRILAFSEATRDELQGLEGGDRLTVVGRLTAEIYHPDGSDPRVSLSIFADKLVALKKKGKKSAASSSAASESYRTGTRRTKIVDDPSLPPPWEA